MSPLDPDTRTLGRLAFVLVAFLLAVAVIFGWQVGTAEAEHLLALAVVCVAFAALL